MPVSLPDDAVSVGYQRTRRYDPEEVFHSPSLKFTGTAREFLSAGHAYRYIQLDKWRRFVLREPSNPYL